MTGHLLLGILALIVTSFGQPNPTEDFSHNATLKHDAYVLYWNFATSDITFEIHAKTKGWVGLGVSANANMIGADIMIGWVKNGNATITDRHGSVINGFPDKDLQQDVNLLSGMECDGWTIIKFSRQLGACEASSDREITSSTTHLIWAYGTDDPTGDDIQSSDVHLKADRGSTSMYLLELERGPSLPENKTYLTANFVSNFTIPAMETYYSCILFKLVPTEKNHVVKVRPIITNGNEAMVHHMIVYSCGRTVPDEAEIGVHARCYTSNMAYFPGCSTLVAAWAIGGTEIVYSDVAGLPIGGTDDSIYFQLETHYDNPSRTPGILDNSGLQLTYTPDLLPNDLGIWQIGSVTSSILNFVPPGQSEYLNVGICAGTCISDAMVEATVNEVTVVAYALHTHLAGRKLKLRHIRNGKEMKPTFDDNYDFNYQESRKLNPSLTVLPGDTFRLECTYNTKERKRMTLHGLGTLDEMCLVFLAYYPKIDVTNCWSGPLPKYSYAYFGINSSTYERSSSLYNAMVTAPANLIGKSVGQVMDEVSWTEAKGAEFVQTLLGATHAQFCQKKDRSKTILSYLNVPSISTEYVIESKTCTSPVTPYNHSKMNDNCPSNDAAVRTLYIGVLLSSMTLWMKTVEM